MQTRPTAAAIKTERLKIQSFTDQLATCRTPAERACVQQALDGAEWRLGELLAAKGCAA